MKVEKVTRVTTVKKMVEVEIPTEEQVYVFTFSKADVLMLRGLHFRLHNNPQRGVRDALDLPYSSWATSDGPGGYAAYDSFLGHVWMATNQFNRELNESERTRR